MAKNVKWADDYWLPLMEIYLRKPVGVKPLYNRQMVDLSLELHIAPQALQTKMHQLSRLQTRRIERIWNTYRQDPRKLSRAVSLWRSMRGYGNAEEFYEGVEVQESFERDFRPIEGADGLTPVMLVLVLDLYFRLTPITMVPETPEIQELAKQMKCGPQPIARAMEAFQHCDPYLNRKAAADSPLQQACRDIWRRYGNGDTELLSQQAEQLKDYFK